MVERRNALAVAVRFTRLSRKGRSVLELIRTDVANLFFGIRARKPALVGGNRLGRGGLVRAVGYRNCINRRAARLERDGLGRPAVVGQSGHR